MATPRSRSSKTVAPATKAVAAARTPKTPRLPKAVATAVEAARDKKAMDTVVLDLRKADGFTDYFVICSAANARQITAIATRCRRRSSSSSASGPRWPKA
jgi:hypothetical protein